MGRGLDHHGAVGIEPCVGVGLEWMCIQDVRWSRWRLVWEGSEYQYMTGQWGELLGQRVDD
ncbi:hypothetical protein [Streptomyces sp. NPDC012510]|uniref:hypothetical protein n=1 Tax=Streptomyces sp. NPDC012510 TaxID=3364838 RepID=UPI0036EA376A